MSGPGCLEAVDTMFCVFEDNKAQRMDKQCINRKPQQKITILKFKFALILS